MSSSKKFELYRDFAAGVYLSEAPSPPRLWLGCSRNFLGSVSPQIQSVKLLQNMVSNATQHRPTLSQLHTVCISCTLIQGGGGIEPERMLEGKQFLNASMHCKSGSHKNGIRKSSRKTYNLIMGI
jgi:hypothetical protein